MLYPQTLLTKAQGFDRSDVEMPRNVSIQISGSLFVGVRVGQMNGFSNIKSKRLA